MKSSNRTITLRKFFIRRFKIFFRVMIIPTILVYAMCLAFIVNRANSTLITHGENSLSGVQTNFDVAIRNTIYQQSLMTNNQNLMLSLKKMVINDGDYNYSDNVFLKDFDSTMQSIVYSNSYLDSTYIYLNGYANFFTSTQKGVVNLNSFYDTGWYNDYVNDNYKHHQWIVKRSIKPYTYTPSVPVLTVFQRIFSTDGVIVMNINESKLVNMLTSIAPDQNEYIYMLDGDYSLLLSDRPNLGPDTEIKKGFFKQYLSEHKTDLKKLSGHWLKIGGNYYLLNHSTYNESNIHVISLISSSALLDYYGKFIIDFVLILIFNILIVLFLAYHTTNRIFRQIDYMIDVFSLSEKGFPTEVPENNMNDEYDVIMNNIIHLFLKNTEINKQLSDRQHRLEIAELAALQLQINPHFLLNTLQTMDLEATKICGAHSEINEIICSLSDILKYALGNPEQPISIKNELDYLKEYVDIQKYRFGDKFIVYYEVDDDLQDYHIYRLLLQPLLENSIIHGVRMLDKTGFIKIKIYSSDDFLKIRVIDNGVGLTKEEISNLYSQINDVHSRSIGLTNVNRRLILAYGNEYGLHIHSKKNFGTCLYFKIPMQ